MTAQIPSIQELIESVKCELRDTAMFTEDQLQALDFCLPNTNPIVPEQIPDAPLPEINNVLPCISQLDNVIATAATNMRNLTKIKIVASKVQEVIDNLNIVDLYYSTRYQTYNTFAIDSTNLIVERDVLTQQLNALPKTSINERAVIQKKIDDANNRITLLKNKSDILSDAKFNVKDFLTSQTFTNELVNMVRQYCSNTQSSKFDPIQVRQDENLLQYNFVLNIPQLKKYKYKDPSTNTDEILDVVSYLMNKDLFKSTPVFQLNAYEDMVSPLLTNFIDIYDKIYGLLYDNTNRPGQYPGLYWKFEAPLDRLFSLDERGLTADPNQLDPVFAAEPSAAIIQDQTNDTKYYIKDVNKYQDFYKNLNTNLEQRMQHERIVVFPDAIKQITDMVKSAANRDALYSLRFNGFLQQTIPGIELTVAVNSSTNIKIDTNKLSTSKGTLASTLDKYRAMSEEIKNKLQDCQNEIQNLTDSANSITVTEESLTAQINAIPCFAPQEDKGDCGDLQAALGSDPLGAKMIAGGTGPSSAYPDLSTMCYWKEFAKCATLVGLLPLPGDNFSNPFKLRYWPVGLVIPTPVMLIKIPLPHIWLPVFCVSTPIGTIVIFIALCGIVPSPFVFFISPSANKSFVLSLKGPQKEMGYDGETLKTNLRLPNPFPAVQKILDQRFPFNPVELNLNLGSDADSLSLLDNSESVIGYLNEFESRAIKQLDSIGDLPMRNFNLAQVSNTLNSLNLSQKIQIIKNDLLDGLDMLKLGSFSVPRDLGKLTIKTPALSTVNDLFKNFASVGDKLSDEAQFKVKSILKTFISQIDNGISLPKTVITRDADKLMANIKAKLKAFNASVFDIAVGNASVPLNTDDLMFNSRELLVEGVAQKQAQEQQYINLLAHTISSILAGAVLDLFNPFKKCCQAKSAVLPDVISPIALVVLHGSRAIIDQIIDSLSSAELALLNQFENVALGPIKSFYESIIMPKFPDASIPNVVNIFNFSTIMGYIAPTLGAISIPQVPINSLALFPAAVTFDLDGIAKTSIRNLLNSTDSITQLLNLNLTTQFAQLSSEDLKASLKNAVRSSVQNVSSKLEPILKPIQAIRGSNGASKTILEASFPIMNVLAEAKAVVKSLQKNSSTIEFVDLAKLAALSNTGLKTAQNIFSSGASYIPVAMLAAMGLESQARLLHPLFNQDDLPSWERLTVKNPLFTLFLDEFCSTAADCTAVILGRTWPQ